MLADPDPEGGPAHSGFVEINPNSKIPALLDTSVNPPLRVFESGSILVYLAEKYGHFLPQDLAGRTECLNWLFWQMGSAPLLGGGFGHFYAYAPEKFEYPINRYTMEVKRQLDVLDRQLAERFDAAGIVQRSRHGHSPGTRRHQPGIRSGRSSEAQQLRSILRWAEELANARRRSGGHQPHLG